MGQRSQRGHGGAGTPATVLLDRLGLSYVLHAYEHEPGTTSYAAEAAELLGADPTRVFKTLLAIADTTGRASHRGRAGMPERDIRDRKLTVAIIPASTSLDLKALATACGAKRATMAEPAQAERSTGYVLGGISPIGQRTRLPTLLDNSAWRHQTILVSGGRRGLSLEVTPDTVVAATGAVIASISRP